MRHEIRHSLEPASARRIIEQAYADYAERYQRYRPELKWHDECHATLAVQVRGMALKGSLAVEPGKLTIQADLPWALRVFSRAAARVIDAEARRWLSAEHGGPTAASA
jgi:hypothetical protein